MSNARAGAGDDADGDSSAAGVLSSGAGGDSSTSGGLSGGVIAAVVVMSALLVASLAVVFFVAGRYHGWQCFGADDSFKSASHDHDHDCVEMTSNPMRTLENATYDSAAAAEVAYREPGAMVTRTGDEKNSSAVIQGMPSPNVADRDREIGGGRAARRTASNMSSASYASIVSESQL